MRRFLIASSKARPARFRIRLRQSGALRDTCGGRFMRLWRARRVAPGFAHLGNVLAANGALWRGFLTALNGFDSAQEGGFGKRGVARQPQIAENARRGGSLDGAKFPAMRVGEINRLARNAYRSSKILSIVQ
jgi:hypothetical protein